MVKDRIDSLRNLMQKQNIHAYIVPSADAHLSEYVSDYDRCREWISGFTGSAGTAVITLDNGGLWTDGRYYIQAENQLKGSGIRLFRMMDDGVPHYKDWLKEQLKEGGCVAFDGKVFSVNMLKELESTFEDTEITLRSDVDFIGDLWQDRPAQPATPVFIHDVKYAGQSRLEKVDLVRKEMAKKEGSQFLLSSLDDIAWLLNIRGRDVPNNPVTIAHVIVTLDSCHLFIDEGKLPASVRAELEKDQILIRDYNDVADYLKRLTEKDRVLYDGDMVNAFLYTTIPSAVSKQALPNITTDLKAVKNSIEIENTKDCLIRDGVAMVRFIKWLKSSLDKEKITEISMTEKLEAFRRQDELFVEPSFDTIAGYKDHAAMMHYKATETSDYTLETKGFLLVDSGGQYYNGTTDITRTIVLGPLSEEEKRDYTLVLKGHIALSTAKFLYGMTGQNVDILARQPLWKHNIDYKCGTGHGIGFFLNVHEGPQRISHVYNSAKLEPGMLVTNEPGIYKEGKHGIRTENILLIVKDELNEYGQFLSFETLTYCPIDVAGVDFSLLTEEEANWLHTYNQNVYDTLAPHLGEDEKAWLKAEIQ